MPARPSPAERGASARRLGRRGERLAARALRRAGYRILARNVVTPHGEVDLLALEGETLVLVEVKTRADGSDPAGGLRPPQRARLRRAGRWLRARARGPRGPLRRDLVLVRVAGRASEVTIRRGRG